MKKLVLFATFGVLFTSCTSNQRARNFGGSEVISLPIGEKLVNIAWKQDNMWLLTRKFVSGETPINYHFKEESSFGLLEGNVTIIESVIDKAELDNLSNKFIINKSK